MKKGSDGKWRTLMSLDEGDDFGASCDRLRVVAANYLYQDNPNLLIVASGGRGQFRDIPDSPPVAAIVKKELIEMGVPEKAILEEAGSNNTFEQLKEIKKLVAQEKFGKIGILSNEWHLPRIKAMVENFPELKDIGVLCQITRSTRDISGILPVIDFLPAEDILLKYDREKWREIIDSIRASEEIKKRIGTEQKGVGDIKAGRYKIK